jgi:hypothetical protein
MEMRGSMHRIKELGEPFHSRLPTMSTTAIGILMGIFLGSLNGTWANCHR